jgi:hypothetical protein
MNWSTLALTLAAVSASLAAVDKAADHADYCYTGDDARESAQLLAKSLRIIDADWETTTDAENVTLKAKGWVVLLSPKMVKDGIDRIVLCSYYPGKSKGNASDPSCLKLMNELNKGNNLLKFCVDPDGDIQVQTSISFRNRLSADDLREAIEYFRVGTTLMMAEQKEQLLKFFK